MLRSEEDNIEETRTINDLCDAAAAGDIKRALFLIKERNIDVNACHTEHNTPPIAWAVQKGQLEMVKLLVEDLGANIFYCEQNKNIKHLFMFALQTKQCGSIITYLDEKGLKFDINGCYHSTSSTLMPILIEFVVKNHWDFLFSIIKNKSHEINMDVFYHPIQKKKYSSLELLTDNNHKEISSTLFGYLMLNYVLKSHTVNFKNLCIELQFYKEKIVKNQKFLQALVSNNLHQQIVFFTELNANLAKLLSIKIHFSRSSEEKYKCFPSEVWLKISKEILSFHLPELNDNDTKTFIALFDSFNKPFVDKYNKMARLASYEWRANHRSLFLFQQPCKETSRENYKLLEECFVEKLSQIDLPSVLRERIITGISKLSWEQFTDRSEILHTIDNTKNNSNREDGIRLRRH